MRIKTTDRLADDIRTEKGYDFHIFVDETRPLLQGARLTAFELQAAGMDVTLPPYRDAFLRLIR